MTRQMTPLGAVLRGLVAATAGTAAMDIQQYLAYRMGGGEIGFLEWEFGGIDDWDQASTPGKVGERLVEAWTEQPLDPKWAGLTNNLVHWGFGIQWGSLYGIVAASRESPSILLGLPYGACVWLFGYAVLPLGHFYQPVWEYDIEALAKDLGSHLVYGTATALCFRLLAPSAPR
jgi:hypothetical protein